MFYRVATIVFGIVLVLALFVGITSAPALASNIKVGVFMPDPDHPGEEIPTVGDIQNFEATIDRQLDVFLWYESISESFYGDYFRPMAQEGRIIQLAWEPHAFGRDPLNQPEYRLERITAGDWDSAIRRWARELRDFGYTVYFRPMSEMNGNWVTWGGTVNGNTPDDYIPAWRHIHDIFVQEGATNVKFVWSPNRDGSTADAQNTFNTYYPGDAYVDYVGINGYNWGTLYNTPEWTSSWQLIEEVFGYSYDVFASRTSKPLMIAETASTEVGGSKAQWITNAFERLPVRFPRIESITWFNINKETDWRVNSSAASLEAFRNAIQGPDAIPPTVSIVSPVSGSTVSGTMSVSANAADDNAVSKVELYVGANLVSTVTAAPYNMSFNTRTVADGAYTLTVKAYDTSGNMTAATASVNIDNGADHNYFFGWYDNASPGMRTWVIIGNTDTVGQHVEIYLGGALLGQYDIGPGQRVTPMFAGVVNGPVKVVSTNGGNLMVSERVLYNGTFSELPAVAEESLASEHYLSWYDQNSPGMLTWIVVGNQGSQTANVEVYVGGQRRGVYAVPAGGRVTPSYPGVIDGPVRVVSTNGQPLSVSERVIYQGAFNEVKGKPAAELATEYNFSWYDQNSPGMLTWIVVGNQGSQTANVEVYVGGQRRGVYAVLAGGRVTPSYPGVIDGPVRVVSTNGQPLVASQRSLYRGSFEEVLGASMADLSSEQWFAWYDNASHGMQTWVLVGNKSGQTAEVDIRIGGAHLGHYTIPAGGRITPVFPGQVNGPVQVTAAGGQDLIVSQRVTYYNSFDEVSGVTLN